MNNIPAGTRRFCRSLHEDYFINLLTHKKICGIITTAETNCMIAVGMRMQRRRLPLGLLLADLSRISWSGGRILSLLRRKEAITWRMHFPAVASVVKVIWFRFRISVARELPSSTRPGSAPTLRAFTTSRSVMVISSSMNPLAMGRSIHTARIGSKDNDQMFIF
jgi:hypothetical protein